MAELESDIRKAIDANLSNEIGTRLKERLARADTDAAQVKALTERLAGAERTIEERNAEIRKHKELAEREVAVAKRESEVLAREVKQQVVDANCAAAHARREDIFNLVSMVFRNPKFVRTEYVNENVPVPSGQYGQQNSTKSTTVEERQE